MLDALDDATEYLSSFNTKSAGRGIRELQELKADITASLLETTGWMLNGETKNPPRINTAGSYCDLRSSERSLEVILNEAC